MTVEIMGGTVSYVDTDPVNSNGKPTVLFLHGWASPAANYRLLTEHLSGYCRVVAPDLPGFGGSDEPPTAWPSSGRWVWTK